MLSRLEIKTPHRSLAPGFWSSAVPFGKRTVIYGHNGSGKSTLSHLLLHIANGNAPVEVTWCDENGTSRKIAVGAGLPDISMSVFTKDWVERNLAAFLEGDSASAIVTLGEEAIGAKEETRLEEEVAQLSTEAKDFEGRQREAQRKIDALAREVQTAISSQLQEFDYKRFTKNKWSTPVVKMRLGDYKSDYPDENEHADALKRLGEGALEPLPNASKPPEIRSDRLQHLRDLLRETPTRVALAELDGIGAAQRWVEQGMELHEGAEHCLFCTGMLTAARRDELARHFDESWLDLRARARGLVGELKTYRSQLQTWLDRLPAADSLASDLSGVYGTQFEIVTDEVGKRVQLVERIEEVARNKENDPSAAPSLPDYSSLTAQLKTGALLGAINEHNTQAAAHAERTEQLVAVVLDHLIGSKSATYRTLTKHLDEANTRHGEKTTAAALAARTLNELKQRQFSSHKMAATLTSDLARVYGKHHLSVAVTPDGKSYACKRGDQAATNLSAGERTTLSLLYFLRKLEDETDSSVPTQRIVVIDDPSSSLDREALFATHQWLIDTLDKFGQYVILTHDFGLLRLFIKSQNNRWTRSVRDVADGVKAERIFPRVSFMEIFTAAYGLARSSKLDALPVMLKNNISEYAYLFSVVMKGIEAGVDAERLFLLPNAARRVLEVFCSYKAPHLPNFDAQLRSLVEGEPGTAEPYRDVYDFCNRYSHGEGAEVIDVLDARAVQGHVRRCMEFLKSVDRVHYERMCQAVRCDPELV